MFDQRTMMSYASIFKHPAENYCTPHYNKNVDTKITLLV